MTKKLQPHGQGYTSVPSLSFASTKLHTNAEPAGEITTTQNNFMLGTIVHHCPAGVIFLYLYFAHGTHAPQYARSRIGCNH